MAAKRFTDANKWRSPWFRKMSMEGRLAWIYLCDECNHAGIWKMDFELASFQLGFEITLPKLLEWFGDKVHLVEDRLVIIPFFNFQYGTSKDSWNAKVTARRELESFGFSVVQNQLIINPKGTVPRLSPDSGGTFLSTGTGKGIGIEGGVGETLAPEEIAERKALIEEANLKIKRSLQIAIGHENLTKRSNDT